VGDAPAVARISASERNHMKKPEERWLTMRWLTDLSSLAVALAMEDWNPNASCQL
jgi:hypothetical protein